MDTPGTTSGPGPEGWWDHLWSSTFMPHGCCYNWQPEIVWSHILSDATICLAYYSIPLILFAFVRKRQDIPFNAIFIIFGIFIFSCGTTHLLEIINVFTPMYRLSAAVKIITAIVSVMAVWMLIPVLPEALALPSLKTANQRLERLSKDLQRSNGELEQFAYVASHDLQEPLRMISMHLDLLNRKEGSQLNEQSRRYLSVATEGAGRMQQLISSLLAFARIDEVPLAQTAVDANLAVADAVMNLSVVVGLQQAEITYHDLPSVRIDRGQLCLIFQNLIGNGIKFGNPHGPRKVDVTGTRQGDKVVFSVKDNGIGIEREHFSRIFTIFQRVHDRKHYDGNGIGLASVKKIVERYGGKIWVESVPGTGSTFHFSVPSPGEAHL